MSRSPIPTPLLLAAPLLLLATGCPKTTGRTASSNGTTTKTGSSVLVEVDNIAIGSRTSAGACRFNGDVPWVVSLHRDLVRPGELDGLEQAVADAGLSRKVILDWFGSDAPERVEVVLGRDLPVPLASAVVALAHDTADGRPVVVSASEQDTELCPRARAYVGSLMATEAPVTDEATLDALEAATGESAFWKLVPPSGR